MLNLNTFAFLCVLCGSFQMLVLGIDTSGKSGGVTLAQGDEHSFRVLGSAPIEGGTFSAQLVPTVARLLEQHSLTPESIDGFAVVSGPGSFTGLRVGLSAVKGLAEILQKPIVTVSLLEAIAVAGGAKGKVIAALDAGRSEIFFGLYDVNGSSATMLREQLLSQQEFLSAAAQPGIAALVSPDDALAKLIPDTRRIPRPGSELVARLGVRKLLRGEAVSVEALDANYLRRSDAEIFFKSNR